MPFDKSFSISNTRSLIRRGVGGIGIVRGLITLAVAAAVLGAGCSTQNGLFDKPVLYEGEEDHFKYGSLGGERSYKTQLGYGIPYWIWVALPELFPEHLPDKMPGRGYTVFGFIYEPGRDPRFDLPIGISQRRFQTIDRVWLNCAVCHTGTVRETPDSPHQIITGMPGNRFNQGAWVKFLFDAANDDRFNAADLLQKIREMQKERQRFSTEGNPGNAPSQPADLGLIDPLLFENIVVPTMKERLLELREKTWFLTFETWGPGRVDTFNPPKAYLNFPMERARPEEKIGVADLPSVWYQQAREGMQLHWDGNNSSLDERNLSAALAATLPPTLDKCSLRRVARYLGTLRPPSFPDSKRTADAAILEQGREIYNANCAECHGAPHPPFKSQGKGERVGTVIPWDEIRTDKHRLDSYTAELASAQNSMYAGYPLDDSEACPGDPEAENYPARFTRFRKTSGYASMPLDGLWLRAPYLHNGSVPNLRALLMRPEERPKVFWIGYDVYNYDSVGFITEGPESAAEGWRYDTAVAGNGNEGHAYGTELPSAHKQALLEYLKTF